MFNFKFIFSPGSCGYFCLKKIVKSKINKEFYINLYRAKVVLNDAGYYCICLKVRDINLIKKQCLSLVRSGRDELHYVIIKKVNKGCVYYYDPLYVFLRKEKINKFIKKWSNICLFYTKV